MSMVNPISLEVFRSALTAIAEEMGAVLTRSSYSPNPAIVTQYDTTTVLPPGWQARIDGMGNIIAEYAERAKE